MFVFGKRKPTTSDSYRRVFWHGGMPFCNTCISIGKKRTEYKTVYLAYKTELKVN